MKSSIILWIDKPGTTGTNGQRTISYPKDRLRFDSCHRRFFLPFASKRVVVMN